MGEAKLVRIAMDSEDDDGDSAKLDPSNALLFVDSERKTIGDCFMMLLMMLLLVVLVWDSNG
ncbi:hypothetical protein GGI21_001442 [Coemansia aciculifera]|nr:hypothetical protein GGI21_001442 [Coemansia aciculifera]